MLRLAIKINSNIRLIHGAPQYHNHRLVSSKTLNFHSAKARVPLQIK